MPVAEFNTLMGLADKTEMFRGKNNEVILANIHMTQGKRMSDCDVIGDKNYTPFVFVDGKLVGSGWTMMNATAQWYEFVLSPAVICLDGPVVTPQSFEFCATSQR